MKNEIIYVDFKNKKVLNKKPVPELTDEQKIKKLYAENKKLLDHILFIEKVIWAQNVPDKVGIIANYLKNKFRNN